MKLSDENNFFKLLLVNVLSTHKYILGLCIPQVLFIKILGIYIGILWKFEYSQSEYSQNLIRL